MFLIRPKIMIKNLLLCVIILIPIVFILADLSISSKSIMFNIVFNMDSIDFCPPTFHVEKQVHKKYQLKSNWLMNRRQA